MLTFKEREAVQNLSSLIRYNNKFHIHKENVAEHSFYVALYTMKLCEFLDLNEEVSNTAIKLALIHDVHEIELSDIPHNVKAANPEINKICLKKEDEFNKLHFYKFMVEYTRTSNMGLIGTIVNIADILDVLHYAEMEVLLGNSSFNEVVNSALNRINIEIENLKVILGKEKSEALKKEITKVKEEE